MEGWRGGGSGVVVVVMMVMVVGWWSGSGSGDRCFIEEVKTYEEIYKSDACSRYCFSMQILSQLFNLLYLLHNLFLRYFTFQTRIFYF